MVGRSNRQREKWADLGSVDPHATAEQQASPEESGIWDLGESRMPQQSSRYLQWDARVRVSQQMGMRVEESK